MSTRCMICFCQDTRDAIIARVYRHADGNPAVVLEDLGSFFGEITKVTGERPRFDEPALLAAQFIVWRAIRHVMDYGGRLLTYDGVRVSEKNYKGIRYRYYVLCKYITQPPEVVFDDLLRD